MTFKVSSLGVAWRKGYRLHVTFDNVSGLDEKSRVKIAGVSAGMVEKIMLKDGKAELILLMEPQIKIYEDAEASLRTAGFLGDKNTILHDFGCKTIYYKGAAKVAYVLQFAILSVCSHQSLKLVT